MQASNQAVLTVVTSDFADRLDYTFTSFAKNPFLTLHAFVIGDALPQKRISGIHYHLEKPDAAFVHPLRDAYYRRMLFIDQLAEEYVLVVDNSDVLCLQSIPELPQLLRGASLGACVEHAGSRYILGQGYTSEYLNCGVTFWHRPSSRKMREEFVARGRARFRSVEDQLTFNEVIQTLHYDQMIILPCQYNFRAHFRMRVRGWPTVSSLDGVRIYHNAASMAEAKKLTGVKPLAELPPLEPDTGELTGWQQFWRKVQLRRQPHIVR